ncbi:hypothetical protein D3C78_1943840 [compost metagenome]
MTLLALGEVLGLGILEAHLDGRVAFLLGGLDLGDDVGAQLDDGHRDDRAVLIKNLGHSEFATQQT